MAFFTATKTAGGILAVLLFFSCATTNPYAPVDQLVEREDFSKSAKVLDEHSKNIYRQKDMVLYYLDKAYSATMREIGKILHRPLKKGNGPLRKILPSA